MNGNTSRQKETKRAISNIQNYRYHIPLYEQPDLKECVY